MGPNVKQILQAVGVAAVFDLGIAGATIGFYYSVLVKPRSILPDPANPFEKKTTWKHYVIFFAAMLSTGICA
jgi:hypothetical protein